MMTISPCSPLYIAGQGPLGSLLAVFFSQARSDVSVIVKNEAQLRSYQRKPITLELENKQLLQAHPPALTLQQATKKSIRYLLVCVKAYDVVPLLTKLEASLSAESVIILIHNGMGVLEEIAERLPTVRMVSVAATIGAYWQAPYQLKGFMQGQLRLGNTQGILNTEEIQQICQDFKQSGVPFAWTEAILPELWHKFAINCSINILTALYQCQNGKLLEHGMLLQALTKEIAAVLSAQGIATDAIQLAKKVQLVCQQTAGNYSSTFKDVEKKKQTEIRYLNEYLVKIASQHQIPVPINVELLQRFYSHFPHYQRASCSRIDAK